MLDMFFIGPREDQDVIEVSDVEFIQKFFQSVVDQLLEGSRRISQSERYNEIFI